MSYKKPLKLSLFQIANILLSLSLIIFFIVQAYGIVKTFPTAQMSGLVRLRPTPMNYFWDLNVSNVSVNQDQIHYYTYYYEELHKLLPNVTDVYGILGYCYHYLGDDSKAVL